VGAIEKVAVGVEVLPDRCIGCKACVDACLIGAVQWDEVGGKPVICVHCGLCARFCPYGVVALEEVDGG
jgi:Fe-S-cluster-containing hydrogenase component 2